MHLFAVTSLLRFARRALPPLLAVLFAFPARAADDAKKSFDVPAGDAAQTLKQFAAQAGREIVFAPEIVGGVTTSAVKGDLTPRAALDKLIAGTGLVAAQEPKTGAFAVRKGPTDPNAQRAVRPTESSARPEKSPSADDAPIELGAFDVVATVQKRPQSAQEVPISMTTLPAHAIERFKVENLRDLSRLTPNMLVSTFNQSQPTIAIRGATNTFSQIGVNKPVAVVIDDVFLPRNTAASFELFDLDSMQVLRGPQGTLFGRNVTGGAIVLNTRLPSFTTREAEAQLDVGNYRALKVQAMASGPLMDGLAAKLTVSSHTHDGYGRDRLTGRAEDDLDSSSVRGQVRWRATPQMKVLVSADYADDRNGGRTLSSKGLGNDGDRRTSELGYPQSYARTMWGVSGRVDWASPVGDFASITAYRESRSAEDYSGVGTSYTFLTAGSQAVSRDLDHPGTFSEELRYASPRWAAGDFVAGLYFLDEDGYRNLVNHAFAARTGAVVTNQIVDQKVTTNSAAAYLDGTWHVAPAVDFTAGARYTSDRKEAAVVRTDIIAPANSFDAGGFAKRWSEFTPRGVLTWSPVRGTKIYASATRGFTSGGFNTEAATAALLARPFDPETVTNYELGVKTGFLNNRLRTSLALFRQKYSDKQELYFNSITRVLTILNASKAAMSGGEFEFDFTLVSGLNLTGGYGRLETRYDDFNVPGVFNNTGNPLGSAPKNKISAGLDYEHALSQHGYLTAVVAVSRTDGYYTGATKDPNLFVPSYSLVNASLGFEAASRKWRVTLWGKNLANTEYLLTPSTQVVLSEYLGEPRTYGVSWGVRF